MENYTKETKMKNVVKICGVINSEFEYDHKVYGEAFYRTKIRVQRLSGEFDNIPIIMSERLGFDRTPSIKDKKVYIEGELKSIFRSDKGRCIYVFVNEIYFVPEEQQDINSIYLEDGVISKPVIYRRTLKENREIADVSIKLEGKYGKVHYLPCIFWGRNAWYMSFRQEGDTIKKIEGRIQSREYTKKLESGEIVEKEVYEVSVSTFEEVV